MKRSTAVGVTCAIGALLVLGARPAAATSSGSAQFVGTATAGPLGSRVGTGCGGAPGPGGLEMCPSASGRGWSFSTTVGVGHGHSNGAPIGPDFAAAVSGILTDGVLDGAWCGMSGGAAGTGSARIGSQSWALSEVGWVQSAGSVIPYSGTASEGDGSSGFIFGVVSAIPPTPATGGGSCTAGTASTFVVVGTATIIVP